MILAWLLGTISAIISRIFIFFAAPMNKFLKPEPKQAQQNVEKGTEGKEEMKRKEPAWKKYSRMPVSEKRKLYRCGHNYVTVNDIPTWAKYRQDNTYRFSKVLAGKKPSQSLYSVNESLNNKVSLWRGDITVLEIDAIVNAANESLLGGGGVDGCIHRAAGETLRRDCATLNGCNTGDAKITSGHKLPAKYIIHTVGPVGEKEKKLRSCYENCLKLVKHHHIETVAFCCISTGIYGYPNYSAAMVALDTVRRWLETSDNAEGVQRIILCIFLQIDVDTYEKLLPRYFPSDEIDRKDHAERVPADEQDERNTEDEEDISAGIPQPPTEEELQSSDLATRQGSGDLAAGQGSGDLAAGQGSSDLAARQGSGDLAAGQGRGDLAAGQGSGDLADGQGSGDLAAGQGSGDLVARQGRGDPAAGLGSGDLAARQGSGDLAAGQGRGDLAAGQGSGDLAARQGSGDLAAGQGSSEEAVMSTESEKDQEKLPAAKPSL